MPLLEWLVRVRRAGRLVKVVRAGLAEVVDHRRDAARVDDWVQVADWENPSQSARSSRRARHAEGQAIGPEIRSALVRMEVVAYIP